MDNGPFSQNPFGK